MPPFEGLATEKSPEGLSETTLRSPVRVGLLIDRWVQPRWIYKVIAEIQTSPVARVALVVKNRKPPEHRRSLVKRIWRNRRILLYLLYRWLDNLWFKEEVDAFEPVDIQPLISKCPVVEVEPIQKRYSDYFGSEDLARIADYGLDVAIRFGFRILKGDVLKIARFGIWSYHHGDPQHYRGGPAGFWEALEGDPVTGSVLQILTEELDRGKVLYRSYGPTDRYSMKRNRNHLYWKSSGFMLRKLRELYEEGPRVIERGIETTVPTPATERIYREPSNLEMVRLLLKLTARVARRKWNHVLFPEQWGLAFRFQETSLERGISCESLRRIVPPKDRFWADPFPVKQEDHYFIFIEEYLNAEKKGHISVLEMDPTGVWKGPWKVLERDYHLSYPFVFEWEGNFYMIPESSSRRTIELYRCVSFPDRWKLHKILMNHVKAVDATLLERAGRWWMFVNIAEEGALNHDELHLFYAKSPMDPWHAHARNPIKSDVRSARPAGRLFDAEGELYRPSQDCSQGYGGGLLLNRVLRITPEEYQEVEVSKIVPPQGGKVRGIHTCNQSGKLVVVDELVRRRRFF